MMLLGIRLTTTLCCSICAEPLNALLLAVIEDASKGEFSFLFSDLKED